MAKSRWNAPGNALIADAVAGEVTVRHAGTSRTEPFDAADALDRVLKQREFLFTRDGDRFMLSASGLELSPIVLGVHPMPDGRCQTVSTVTVRHPTLIPGGLFEYQHSKGRFVTGGLTTGFGEWVETDLVVLVEAVTGELDSCTAVDLILPAMAEGQRAWARRMFVGPVDVRFSSAAGGPPGQPKSDGAAHGPSTILLASPEPFVDQIESDATFGIRFYAVRQPDGSAAADCRVNGEEFEPGKAAARKYVKTWPGRSPQAQKQYVVIRSADGPIGVRE